MIPRRLLGSVVAAAAVLVAPAGAVGLGPLRHEGTTISPRKGFYLTLINPYRSAERFRLAAVGWSDETPEARVLIPIDQPRLAGGGQRRLLVVATDLQPGERRQFRVCAERISPEPKEMIHARVCAKLIARRLG